MNGWFDDPFFTNSGFDFGGVHDHFADMHQQMNRMMSSMFGGFSDSFAALEDQTPQHRKPRVEEIEDVPRDQRRRSSTRPIVEEVDDESPRFRSSASRSRPIVEEPDDEPRGTKSRGGVGPQTYFYSSSMSSYRGPDGVQHAKKKTYDSSTGRTEMAEMRKLGDQAVAMKREIDGDGRVRDHVDRRNLDESELESFGRRWKERSPSVPRLQRSGGGCRRALK
jgi:hypothetical protein